MQKDLRIKFFLILIIALIPNLALTSETAFHPLASINARTIRKGTLSLGRAPIGNLNSNFLTSSLNFGILERLEVGTAPLFYVIPEHKYNTLAKYNFYRGSNIDWAITYGKTVFTTELEISGEKEKPDIEMESSQLVMNLHPTDSKWSYGLSGTVSCGKINSKDAYVRIYSFRCETEHGIDVQYETKKDQWLTVGHGKMRESGITPFESTNSGAGIAYTWFRENMLLSRPSIGVYQHWGQNLMFLFSTTFYEIR